MRPELRLKEKTLEPGKTLAGKSNHKQSRKKILKALSGGRRADWRGEFSGC
jgi:hypothetical protein